MDSGSQTATHYNTHVYSPELLDHFDNPRNAGVLESPDATVRLENPACGDVLELSAKVEAGKIIEIRFRAKGCVPAMACGSAITELVKGNSLAAVRNIQRNDLVQKIRCLPEASGHASQLAIDALHELLRKL
jgi:nitrogen fixation protein NifU and related proteins